MEVFVFGMINRCFGLNVVGSQCLWQTWLPLPRLKRFTERQHCMFILIRFSKKVPVSNKNILQRRFSISLRYPSAFHIIFKRTDLGNLLGIILWFVNRINEISVKMMLDTSIARSIRLSYSFKLLSFSCSFTMFHKFLHYQWLFQMYPPFWPRKKALYHGYWVLWENSPEYLLWQYLCFLFYIG